MLSATYIFSVIITIYHEAESGITIYTSIAQISDIE